MRTLFACLLAPALFPLAYLAWSSVTGAPAPVEAVTGMVVPLSYVMMFALGLPVHLALRRMHEASMPAYLVVGLLLAVFAQLTYLDGLIANWHLWWGSLMGEIRLGPVHNLGGQAGWWLYGAATGGVFWLIARPDLLRRGKSSAGIILDGPNRSVR